MIKDKELNKWYE